MENKTLTKKTQFLAGEGEMARLIRSLDWSQHSLGPIEDWPQSLRTTLSLILHSKFPMFLFWGPELIAFYNDAYRSNLEDNGKHPKALGQRGEWIWPEIWPYLKPLIDQVMAGEEVTWSEEQVPPIYRSGRTKGVYWTYSPIHDESDKIGGIFVTCSELTDKVINRATIEENKDQLQFAIEAAELGTWDLNPFTHRLTGNNRLKVWFGLADEEDPDLSMALNAVAHKDRQRVTEAIQAALNPASGGQYDIEYTIVNPVDKRERRVKTKGKAFFNKFGNPYRFNGIMQDITEELRGQNEQQKLITLVENSVDLMSILGLDGKNSYINKAGKQLLGIDDDQDVSQIPISDLHTPEQFAFVSSEIIPSVMELGRWSGQFSARNLKTGETVPLYNNCLRIDDQNTGLPLAIGAVMRDLRPEMAVQSALEESKERFRLLADFMPQFVWTATSSGRLNYFNQSVYDYSGLSVETLMNDGWLMIIHPDERRANINAWLACIKSGEDFVFQHRFRRFDGEYRWQLSRAVPMRDNHGIIQWWVGTSTDIDEQKKVADELEQMVQQRTQELHKSNQELIKINHELEQFAYIASHDLQEPLRKIQSFSELLHIHLHDAELAGQYVEKISTSAQRMADLIKSVLNYSRLPDTADQFTKVDLNQVLERVESDFELLIDQKKATIRYTDLPVILGVPMHLYQLFSNLISNSLKFSITMPIVDISSIPLLPTETVQLQGLNSDIRYVYIQFKDNGIGFEQEYSERIFTIFQRLNHRKSYTGTGIGLALCRKIVESHGGVITAESELNQGATFHIYLPIGR